jgi:hypothetical protein
MSTLIKGREPGSTYSSSDSIGIKGEEEEGGGGVRTGTICGWYSVSCRSKGAGSGSSSGSSGTIGHSCRPCMQQEEHTPPSFYSGKFSESVCPEPTLANDHRFCFKANTRRHTKRHRHNNKKAFLFCLFCLFCLFPRTVAMKCARISAPAFRISTMPALLARRAADSADTPSRSLIVASAPWASSKTTRSRLLPSVA